MVVPWPKGNALDALATAMRTTYRQVSDEENVTPFWLGWLERSKLVFARGHDGEYLAILCISDPESLLRIIDEVTREIGL